MQRPRGVRVYRKVKLDEEGNGRGGGIPWYSMERDASEQ